MLSVLAISPCFMLKFLGMKELFSASVGPDSCSSRIGCLDLSGMKRRLSPSDPFSAEGNEHREILARSWSFDPVQPIRTSHDIV